MPIADPIPSRAPSRLAGVDVLRGISVLLVTVHHIHLRFLLNGYPVDDRLPGTLNRPLFWSGYYAVIVFFVISGFLITSLSIRRWGELGSIRVGQFFTMRAARILPCLLALLLVLSSLHLAGIRDFTINPGRASLPEALFAAVTFHVNYLEGHHGYLPGGWDVLWSLSVEEIFYLAFPILCLLLRREWLLVPGLICLIVVGPINRMQLADQDPWGQYAYLSCVDGIAMGCIAALAAARLHWSPRVLRACLLTGALIACVVIAASTSGTLSILKRFGLDVSALEIGVAMMLLAFGRDVGNRSLSRHTTWLRTIGSSSYEIYLTHMLVVLGLMHFVRVFGPGLRQLPLWYAAMLALSVLLGHAVSRYFSEPVNRAMRNYAAASGSYPRFGPNQRSSSCTVSPLRRE